MRYLFISLFILVLSDIAAANTWNVPGDAPTIQAGIDLASSGDTIEIESGVYTDCTHYAYVPGSGSPRLVCFELKPNVTVRSASGNPADVVVDAHSVGGVVLSYDDDSAVIQGITIRGGFSTNIWNGCGAGIYCHGSDLIVSDCIFEDNISPDHGGGAMIYYCSPIITNCTFRNNTASTSGGGAYISTGSTILTGCTFNSNIVTALGYGDGGGAYFDGQGSPNISGCILTGNVAPAKGGGFVVNDGPVFTMNNCQINLNTAELGGGLCLEQYPASAWIYDCSIQGNVASSGGGIYISYNTSLTGANVDFVNNTANTGLDGNVVLGGNAVLTCCLTDQALWSGQVIIDNSSCGAIDAEAMSWGALKQLFR